MDLNALRQNALYDAKKGAFMGNMVQPGSFLQAEIPTANNKASYAIAINQNNGFASRASEKRLNQNDLFVATHVGLFLKREDSAKPGSGVLQTYPNATIFADEATYLAGADLEAIYNSNMSIKVADTVYSEGIDMNPCRTVRTTQQSSATTKSERFSLDGFQDLVPIITFDGSKKNDIVLNIANWTGQLIQNSTAGAGQTVYIVVKFFGFLVTGASNIAR